MIHLSLFISFIILNFFIIIYYSGFLGFWVSGIEMTKYIKLNAQRPRRRHCKMVREPLKQCNHILQKQNSEKQCEMVLKSGKWHHVTGMPTMFAGAQYEVQGMVSSAKTALMTFF